MLNAIEKKAELEARIAKLNTALDEGVLIMDGQQRRGQTMVLSFESWDIKAKRFEYAERFIAFLNTNLPGLTEKLGINDPRSLFTEFAQYVPEAFMMSGNVPTGKVSFPRAGVSIEIDTPDYHGVGNQKSVPIKITAPFDEGPQTLTCYI